MACDAAEATTAPLKSGRSYDAQGSLRAARFLRGRPAGLYDMFDVLGLN